MPAIYGKFDGAPLQNSILKRGTNRDPTCFQIILGEKFKKHQKVLKFAF